MKTKVSVIIPAYNAEKYVCCAVDSALAQTLRDTEIVIVDDCSADGTLELITAKYGSDERVKILSQPHNGGVGAARNRGMKEAKGEYIAFLDADDAYMPDMLEKMYAAAKEHEAEVLHTTGCLLPCAMPAPDDLLELEPEQYRPYIPEICEPGETVYYAPADVSVRLNEWCGHKYHWSVWNKLFLRSFIEENGIGFDKLSMAEDMVFCLKALFLAKKYVVLPGQWYVYRLLGDSLSRRESSVETVIKLTENQIKAAEAVARFTSGQGYFKDHPADQVRVQKAVCDSIDRFYLASTIAELTPEKVQNSGRIAELFQKEYGEKSAFVGYLYWRLHDLYKDGFNFAALGSNADGLSGETEKLKQKRREENKNEQ